MDPKAVLPKPAPIKIIVTGISKVGLNSCCIKEAFSVGDSTCSEERDKYIQPSFNILP
jgi:hypothetical protein